MPIREEENFMKQFLLCSILSKHQLSETFKNSSLYAQRRVQNIERSDEFYNKGGGKAFGFKVENQTLSDDPLQLTDKETDDIIEFMKALNDQ